MFTGTFRYFAITSDTCVGNICETRDGNCTYDCIEGFNGDGCNIADLIRLAPGEQWNGLI
jgi:hypothetical protein